MAEKGQTSSMTSVTEEESSAGSESDTTESSYSNITSSVLSSTDTDDKLTPGLISISISNTASSHSSPSKKRKQVQDDTFTCNADTGFSDDAKTESQKVHHGQISGSTTQTNDNSSLPVVSTTTTIVHPYGSNPLPLDSAGQDRKKRRKEINLPVPSAYSNTAQSDPLLFMMKERVSPTFCKENLGIDDTDNRLSTDFSDTSSIPGDKGNENHNNNSGLEVDSLENVQTTDVEERLRDQRPFFPDMQTDSWYRARCFDRYWTHYSFVMDWYQAHVHAVQTLQGRMAGTWGFPMAHRHRHSQDMSQRGRRKKKSRNSRHRGSKAQTKSKHMDTASVSLSASETNLASPGVHTVSSSKKGTDSEEDEELKMEITDDMMEFFTTSFKHRLERDGAKEGDEKNRQNIEEAMAGQAGPSSSAPTERPGVRRTAEMRELYGAGAPMIHGMETALQMTFDRVSDRFQPKLWPNMPLKIIFS